MERREGLEADPELLILPITNEIPLSPMASPAGH
jgi:hypothetical protein